MRREWSDIWKALLVKTVYPKKIYKVRTGLHGGGGPQVGEVTRLGGVTRFSI